MMDPVSFLLGFTRALTPPMAPPAPQSVVPMHATTNLGLDHDRLKAIYADSRVAAAPQPGPPAAGAPAPDAQGGQPAPPTPQAQQAQQAQQVQQPSRVAAIDAADRAAMIDPLMAARMKEIYADRLTLSAPAIRPEVWRTLDAPMPWSL